MNLNHSDIKILSSQEKQIKIENLDVTVNIDFMLVRNQKLELMITAKRQEGLLTITDYSASRDVNKDKPLTEERKSELKALFESDDFLTKLTTQLETHYAQKVFPKLKQSATV